MAISEIFDRNQTFLENLNKIEIFEIFEGKRNFVDNFDQNRRRRGIAAVPISRGIFQLEHIARQKSIFFEILIAIEIFKILAEIENFEIST